MTTGLTLVLDHQLVAVNCDHLEVARLDCGRLGQRHTREGEPQYKRRHQAWQPSRFRTHRSSPWGSRSQSARAVSIRRRNRPGAAPGGCPGTPRVRMYDLRKSGQPMRRDCTTFVAALAALLALAGCAPLTRIEAPEVVNLAVRNVEIR